MSKSNQQGEDAAYRATVREYWLLHQAVLQIDEAMTEENNMGEIITKIQIQGPELKQGGWLAIIKGLDAARKPIVAFRSASSLKELGLKIAGDIANGTLTFREEKPWEPTPEGATGKKGAAGG